MLLLIPFSFLYLFLFYTFSFHSFTLSFYRTLYNLYLNPNLLKILSNYTYTIPKVTILHTYILTSCLIFFYAFSLFLLFLHAFSSYFLTFPTHCLAVPKLILLYLVISYYPFNCKHCIMPSYCAVLYLVIINFIGSSFKLLCNSALLYHSSIIY